MAAMAARTSVGVEMVRRFVMVVGGGVGPRLVVGAMEGLGRDSNGG